jgi:hypothetical protein
MKIIKQKTKTLTTRDNGRRFSPFLNKEVAIRIGLKK